MSEEPWFKYGESLLNSLIKRKNKRQAFGVDVEYAVMSPEDYISMTAYIRYLINEDKKIDNMCGLWLKAVPNNMMPLVIGYSDTSDYYDGVMVLTADEWEELDLPY